MTKSGDHYLRMMMIHRARAAIRWSREQDTQFERWINPIIERRGFNKTIVLATNKNSRITCNTVTNGAHYGSTTRGGIRFSLSGPPRGLQQPMRKSATTLRES